MIRKLKALPTRIKFVMALALFVILTIPVYAAIGDAWAIQDSDGVDVIRLTETKMIPGVTATLDLGDSTHKFKDGYFSGDVTVSGTLNKESESITSTGFSHLGDGTEDETTMAGRVYANDGVTVTGSTSLATLAVSGTADINGVTTMAAHVYANDDMTVAGSTSLAGTTLTTLTASSGVNLNGDTTLGNALSDSVTVNGTADLKSVRASGYYNISIQDTPADYTVVAGGNHFITVSNTDAAREVFLPTSASMGPGGVLIVKDTSGSANVNNITITPNGSETVDGAASVKISTAYGAIHLITDGTNWFTW